MSFFGTVFRGFFDFCSSSWTSPDKETTYGTRLQLRGSNRSPAVDTGVETIGDYMLEDDLKRRTTLAFLLQQDGAQIRELWMQKITEKSLGQMVLTNQHLDTLMNGFNSYITNQCSPFLQTEVRRLKEEFGCDANTIGHLQLVVYLYQESVNEILKLHLIKPIWMFALENLVRGGVHAALVVLSPELQENLSDQSSPLAPNHPNMNNLSNDSYNFSEYLIQLREENFRVLREIETTARQSYLWLRKLYERDFHYLEEFKNLCAVRHPAAEDIEQDQQLSNWLGERGLYPCAQSLLTNGYTLDNIINHVAREDLLLARLRPGVEFQVWRAITQFRFERTHRLEMAGNNEVVQSATN